MFIQFISAILILVASILIFGTGIGALLYRLTVERTPHKARLFEFVCTVLGPVTYKISFVAGLLILAGASPSWWPALVSIAGLLPATLYFELGAKELLYINALSTEEQQECAVIDSRAAGRACCLVSGGFFLGLCILLAMRLF